MLTNNPANVRAKDPWQDLDWRIAGIAAALIIGGLGLSSGDAIAARHAISAASDFITGGELPESPEAEVKLMERAIAAAERRRGPFDPLVAELVMKLGSLYEASGLNDQAEAAYLKSLAITETGFGASSLAIIAIAGSLGVFYQKQERYQKAEVQFKRSIAVSEANLPSERASLVMGLRNLAQLYDQQGKS